MLISIHDGKNAHYVLADNYFQTWSIQNGWTTGLQIQHKRSLPCCWRCLPDTFNVSRTSAKSEDHQNFFFLNVLHHKYNNLHKYDEPEWSQFEKELSSVESSQRFSKNDEEFVTRSVRCHHLHWSQDLLQKSIYIIWIRVLELHTMSQSASLQQHPWSIWHGIDKDGLHPSQEKLHVIQSHVMLPNLSLS